MAEKNNATCSICGNSYYVCMSCKDSIRLQPWKVHCCSADCYKTYQVVRGFSTGVYTKNEFKSKLKNIDLSNLENYREHIKVLIKDALKEDEIVVEAAKKVDKLVENLTSEVSEMPETEETTVKPSVYSRKKNYKIEAE